MNMKYLSSLLSLILIVSFISSCTCTKKTESSKEESNKASGPMGMAAPPLIIYKTKADYNDKVPVILSEDKSKIVSYPGTKDVFYQGKLATPTLLEGGYLLDNRGIDEHVAFLGISYDTYSKSMRMFSENQLFESIIDDDPIIEMYRCSRRGFKSIPEDINTMIRKGDFSPCEKLK
jgi:hypothetical protein